MKGSGGGIIKGSKKPSSTLLSGASPLAVAAALSAANKDGGISQTPGPGGRKSASGGGIGSKSGPRAGSGSGGPVAGAMSSVPRSNHPRISSSQTNAIQQLRLGAQAGRHSGNLDSAGGNGGGLGSAAVPSSQHQPGISSGQEFVPDMMSDYARHFLTFTEQRVQQRTTNAGPSSRTAYPTPSIPLRATGAPQGTSTAAQPGGTPAQPGAATSNFFYATGSHRLPPPPPAARGYSPSNRISAERRPIGGRVVSVVRPTSESPTSDITGDTGTQANSVSRHLSRDRSHQHPFIQHRSTSSSTTPSSGADSNNPVNRPGLVRNITNPDSSGENNNAVETVAPTPLRNWSGPNMNFSSAVGDAGATASSAAAGILGNGPPHSFSRNLAQNQQQQQPPLEGTSSSMPRGPHAITRIQNPMVAAAMARKARHGRFPLVSADSSPGLQHEEFITGTNGSGGDLGAHNNSINNEESDPAVAASTAAALLGRPDYSISADSDQNDHRGILAPFYQREDSFNNGISSPLNGPTSPVTSVPERFETGSVGGSVKSNASSGAGSSRKAEEMEMGSSPLVINRNPRGAKSRKINASSTAALAAAAAANITAGSNAPPPPHPGKRTEENKKPSEGAKNGAGQPSDSNPPSTAAAAVSRFARTVPDPVLEPPPKSNQKTGGYWSRNNGSSQGAKQKRQQKKSTPVVSHDTTPQSMDASPNGGGGNRRRQRRQKERNGGRGASGRRRSIVRMGMTGSRGWKPGLETIISAGSRVFKRDGQHNNNNSGSGSSTTGSSPSTPISAAASSADTKANAKLSEAEIAKIPGKPGKSFPSSSLRSSAGRGTKPKPAASLQAFASDGNREIEDSDGGNDEQLEFPKPPMTPWQEEDEKDSEDESGLPARPSVTQLGDNAIGNEQDGKARTALKIATQATPQDSSNAPRGIMARSMPPSLIEEVDSKLSANANAEAKGEKFRSNEHTPDAAAGTRAPTSPAMRKEDSRQATMTMRSTPKDSDKKREGKIPSSSESGEKLAQEVKHNIDHTANSPNEPISSESLQSTDSWQTAPSVVEPYGENGGNEEKEEIPPPSPLSFSKSALANALAPAQRKGVPLDIPSSLIGSNDISGIMGKTFFPDGPIVPPSPYRRPKKSSKSSARRDPNIVPLKKPQLSPDATLAEEEEGSKDDHKTKSSNDGVSAGSSSGSKSSGNILKKITNAFPKGAPEPGRKPPSSITAKLKPPATTKKSGKERGDIATAAYGREKEKENVDDSERLRRLAIAAEKRGSSRSSAAAVRTAKCLSHAKKVQEGIRMKTQNWAPVEHDASRKLSPRSYQEVVNPHLIKTENDKSNGSEADPAASSEDEVSPVTSHEDEFGINASKIDKSNTFDKNKNPNQAGPDKHMHVPSSGIPGEEPQTILKNPSPPKPPAVDGDTKPSDERGQQAGQSSSSLLATIRPDQNGNRPLSLQPDALLRIAHSSSVKHMKSSAALGFVRSMNEKALASTPSNPTIVASAKVELDGVISPAGATTASANKAERNPAEPALASEDTLPATEPTPFSDRVAAINLSSQERRRRASQLAAARKSEEVSDTSGIIAPRFPPAKVVDTDKSKGLAPPPKVIPTRSFQPRSAAARASLGLSPLTGAVQGKSGTDESEVDDNDEFEKFRKAAAKLSTTVQKTKIGHASSSSSYSLQPGYADPEDDVSALSYGLPPFEVRFPRMSSTSSISAIGSVTGQGVDFKDFKRSESSKTLGSDRTDRSVRWHAEVVTKIEPARPAVPDEDEQFVGCGSAEENFVMKWIHAVGKKCQGDQLLALKAKSTEAMMSQLLDEAVDGKDGDPSNNRGNGSILFLGGPAADDQPDAFEAGIRHFEAGEFPEAKACFLATLKKRVSNFGLSHVETCLAQEKLADTLVKLGFVEEAYWRYQLALRNMVPQPRRNHAHISRVLLSLGNLYFEAGNYARALRFYEKSVAIRMDSQDEDPVEVVNSVRQAVRVHDALAANSLDSLDSIMALFHVREVLWHLRLVPLGLRAAVWNGNNFHRFERDAASSTSSTHLDSTSEIDSSGRPFSYVMEAIRLLKMKGADGTNDEITSVLDSIASIYIGKNETDKARQCYKEKLDFMRTYLREEHKTIANTYYDLGNVCTKMGDHNNATEYFSRALRVQRKVYSQYDDKVGLVLRSLAASYIATSNYTVALRYYGQYLDFSTGDDEMEVLSIMGIVYSKLYRLSESLNCYVEALQIESMDHDESDTLVEVVDSLRNVFLSPRKFSRQTNCNEIAMDFQDMKIVLHNLGLAHLQRRFSVREETYLEEVIGLLLNDEDSKQKVDFSRVLGCMGNILFRRCRYKEAIQYYDKFLNTQDPSEFVRQPDMIEILTNIGTAYLKIDAHEKSLVNFTRALEEMEAAHLDKSSGDDERSMTGSLNGASVRSHLAHLKTKSRGISDDNHEEVLRVRHLGALISCKDGKFHEAIGILEDVMRRRVLSLGNDHPDVVDLHLDMSVAYILSGDKLKAHRMFEIAFERMQTSKVETNQLFAARFRRLQRWHCSDTH